MNRLCLSGQAGSCHALDRPEAARARRVNLTLHGTLGRFTYRNWRASFGVKQRCWKANLCPVLTFAKCFRLGFGLSGMGHDSFFVFVCSFLASTRTSQPFPTVSITPPMFAALQVRRTYRHSRQDTARCPTYADMSAISISFFHLPVDSGDMKYNTVHSPNA